MRNVLKITTLVLALVMVLGIGMAFAAPSVVATVEDPVDGDNAKVPYTTSSVTITTADAAAAAGQKEPASDLAVVWQGDIAKAYEGKAITFPVSVDGTYYAYHWNGTAWELVDGPKASTGKKVTFTFPSLSPVAIVQGSATTPQTGDSSNIALWGGLMVAAIAVAAGTVVYSRKRKNEA